MLGMTVMVFAACSTSKTAQNPTVSRGDISGKWMVSNVGLEGFPAGYAASNVFDMGKPADFQGSTWELQGSGNGMITLTNGKSQSIYWSVNKDTTVPSFQFKKVYADEKPKDVETGYRLDFGTVANGSAVLRTPVALASGQTAYINFTMTKQ